MPDENDIVFDTYGVDLVGIVRALLEKLFGVDGDAVLNTIGDIWSIYSIVALLLALLFFIGFVYAKIRYGQLADEETELIKQEEQAWAARYGSATVRNDRWEDVQQHIASDDPNGWRLAIIEADVMLDEALTNAGYVGDTLGEKLKGANTNALPSLEDAWAAHKVRNDIAHSGSDFVLTKKVAQETITRFERVFRDLGIL